MSKQARKDELQKLHKLVSKRSPIETIDHEYTLYEIAIITRAGQSYSIRNE